MQAKPLTEKLLSQERWPGRWITSTIVPGADPQPSAPEKPLHFPRSIQTRSNLQCGLQGGTGSLEAQAESLPQHPCPSLTPGPPPKAQALFLEQKQQEPFCLNTPSRPLPFSASILSSILFDLF